MRLHPDFWQHSRIRVLHTIFRTKRSPAPPPKSEFARTPMLFIICFLKMQLDLWISVFVSLFDNLYLFFILQFFLGSCVFPAQSPKLLQCVHCIITVRFLKAGVHLKAVFWLGIMFLMQISRLRFKQSRICSLITHIYVLRRFVNFLVIFRFIWRQIVFLKGLVKFMEIGNFEDLVLF